MKSNFLVTGGAGFIGSHVVNELIELKQSVVVLDDLSGGFRDNVNPNAKFVEGSILDHESVDRLFEEYRFDYVFHLAAYAAEGLSHFIKRYNYMNNLIGSVNLINASINSKNVKCFVFTSSIAVYGGNQLPMTEDLIPKPEDPYGIAKHAVEMELKVSRELFDLNYIIFRPHNVYGEHQNIADKYRNVVGIFMNQILQDQPLTIFGDGNQKRAFSYIGDVAPVIARSAYETKAYGEIFNIGADVPYDVNMLANEVCAAMGVEPRMIHLEPRNEVLHAYADHQKVGAYFPDQTEPVSLKVGLKNMAEWVKAFGARKTSEFTNIEVLHRLPPSWGKV